MSLKQSTFILAIVALGLLPACGRAQNSADITDPFEILTYKDSSGSCVPQQSDNGSQNVAGCCDAPGRRSCVGNGTDGTPLPSCLALDKSLKMDPYGAGTLCTLAAVAIDPALDTLGQTGTDMTFYVTSDLHFFRRTFNLTDQLTHLRVMNNFFSSGAAWPSGTGIPANTPVGKPLAVVIDGDFTTHGLAQDLSAFRINYERGTLPSSIQYPVLFGLGNHELVSDETPQNAERMFNYLQARMANTHIDPASGDYSWDWQGVHFVQLNTWAGDQTSAYVHTSDGLTWLANDLKTYVGNTTKPVMLFQHYLLLNVYPWRVTTTADDDFFPTDGNAIDSTGALTGKGYETFWKTIQNYNVIGMFGGHNHCLGMYNTMISNLPVKGTLYPSIKGYGVPMDDYDDGSGGDTGDGTDNQASLGNGCNATVINGQTIKQNAVASFLVAHVEQNYLDVGAVSWQGDGSAPYFDAAAGMPTGALACRKRINSQFVLAPSTVKAMPTNGGYIVSSSVDTPASVPVALRFNSRSGMAGFQFVDACADATDSGANNLYFLANDENSLTANISYTVVVNNTGGKTDLPSVVLLTPLSGVSPAALTHSAGIAPANDTLTVYGPANTGYTTQVSYAGSTDNWLSLAPATGTFNNYGIATLTVQYQTPTAGYGKSSADVAITSTATGVLQHASVSITQPTLVLALSQDAIYQGGTVSLAATLTPTISGVAINFMSGTSLLGSATTDTGGNASLSYTAMTAGTMSIVASVGGTLVTASSSQSLVVGPPVSLVIVASSTIRPGQTGTISLQLSSFGGFMGIASVSCSSPVSYVTCHPSASSETFTGGTAITLPATITVAATAASAGDTDRSNFLLCLLLPFAAIFRLRQETRKRFRPLVAIVVLAFTFNLLLGCGKSSGANTASPAPAPTGSQEVTFTVLAGGVSQKATVTVNFQ